MDFSGKSWKTTGAGLSVILIAAGDAIKAVTDNNPATSVDVGMLVAAIISGVGLMAARDNNKSSESVGAK